MSTNSSTKKQLIYASIGVLLVSIYSYFLNYHYPAELAWDENYHIASAQKYLNGVMFMEPHPPLGKLFIALGEWFLQPNQHVDTSTFLHTDYITALPEGYSFIGVRFFPILFACATAVLFFWILYQLSQQLILAALFSSLYLFENAMIVHSRTAMLESTQMFFIFASICYFLYRLDKTENNWKHYFILGIFIGLAVAVKLNSLILLLLFPGLFFYQKRKLLTRQELKYLASCGISFLFSTLLIFFLSYYVHFTLGQKVSENKYQASAKYLEVLKKQETHNIFHFATMLRDNVAYIKKYEQGVPSEHQPGSSPGTWAFGNKSINYHSQTFSADNKTGKTRFLYLQGNPLIWFLVLLGVILSLSQIIASAFFHLKVNDRKSFYLINIFTLMYLSYLAVMFNLGRVMYLYHYLIPLFLGSFLFYLQFNQILATKITQKSVPIYFASAILVLEIVLCYFYFSPLTYYQPLSAEAFIQRQWMDFWRLEMSR